MRRPSRACSARPGRRRPGSRAPRARSAPPADRPGVGVEQQLGRVVAQTRARIVTAGGAVPVGLPGADPGDETVPDARVVVQQRDLGLGAVAVEQAQQHAVGGGGRHREVRPAVARGRAERERAARQRWRAAAAVGAPRSWSVSWPGLPGNGTDHVADGADRAVAAADHVGDQPGPAGLVRGAQPGAVVAVEVLVEQQVVFPGRVVLQPVDPAEAGPPPVRADGEQEMSRSRRSAAISPSGTLCPDPAGYSMVSSSPKNR